MTAHLSGEYLVRTSEPQDADAMRRMLEQLDPDEVWLRFFHSVRRFSADLVAALLHHSDSKRLSLVAVDPDGGEIVGSAMLEPADDGGAEFAVLVHHGHTQHGLGRRLVEGLLAGAAARGYAQVYGLVRRENGRMLQLAAEMGAHIGTDRHEPDCMRVQFALPRALAA